MPESRLATWASDTHSPTALLEISSARATPLQLSPACWCRRNVSRILDIVILLVGTMSDRKKR